MRPAILTWVVLNKFSQRQFLAMISLRHRTSYRRTVPADTIRSVFAGIEAVGDGSFQALLDWQPLDRLNGLARWEILWHCRVCIRHFAGCLSLRESSVHSQSGAMSCRTTRRRGPRSRQRIGPFAGAIGVAIWLN